MPEIYWKEENILTIEETLKEGLSNRLNRSELVNFFREKVGYDITVDTVSRWCKNLGLQLEANSKYNRPKGKHAVSLLNQELGEIPGEEFVPVILPNLDCTPYTVSQYGNVRGRKGQKLKWANSNGYPSVTMRLPVERFSEYDHIPWQPGSAHVNTRAKATKVHTLVGRFFLPRPIPPVFKDIWDTLTEEQKTWAQSPYILDHIDDNRGNPHVSNLQWVLNKDNNKEVKEFKKNKIDQ